MCFIIITINWTICGMCNWLHRFNGPCSISCLSIVEWCSHYHFQLCLDDAIAFKMKWWWLRQKISFQHFRFLWTRLFGVFLALKRTLELPIFFRINVYCFDFTCHSHRFYLLLTVDLCFFLFHFNFIIGQQNPNDQNMAESYMDGSN